MNQHWTIPCTASGQWHEPPPLGCSEWVGLLQLMFHEMDSSLSLSFMRHFRQGLVHGPALLPGLRIGVGWVGAPEDAEDASERWEGGGRDCH